MADKKIQIQIAATGAQQAAREIERVTTATDSLADNMEGTRGVAGSAQQSAAPLARRGPTVQALAPALGLTEEQVDAMFIQAESLAV